jgi:hypothetical protein
MVTDLQNPLPFFYQEGFISHTYFEFFSIISLEKNRGGKDCLCKEPSDHSNVCLKEFLIRL